MHIIVISHLTTKSRSVVYENVTSKGGLVVKIESQLLSMSPKITLSPINAISAVHAGLMMLEFPLEKHSIFCFLANF